MAVEIDIEALLKTVDEFADRAEDSRNLILLGLPNQTVCEDLPWKRVQP